ncbi:Abi family protein [Clostridium guangxiense]|uniref:Abi family protein n=1 Tax=Clostridium guangxiense TaxID=1662055 RepID=UPI000AE021C3|nr:MULTISPECIES: Abi family protein [Clostridium]MCD2346738.1 Abi family protein [Clostridium guangxiense]
MGPFYNSNKPFIKHHNEKYDGKLHIWVATEIMSFGMLSKLYSNLIPEDKSFIKANF